MVHRRSKAAGPAAATCLLALCAAHAAWSQSIAPVDDAALRAMSLAAGCAQCHGTNGHAPPGATAPSLAGMPAAAFLARFEALRRAAPTPAAGVMRRIAAGYSDPQLRTLAAYFAAQPP
jgi:cytochrome c553